MRPFALSIASLLCLSAGAYAATVPDWEDQVDEVSVPLGSGAPLRALVLPNGHQLALGGIQSVAGLFASEMGPDGSFIESYAVGDGLLSSAREISRTAAFGDRLAVVGAAEDVAGSQTAFLAMWEVDLGFRWQVAVESGISQIAHFPAAVVMLHPPYTHIEAYAAGSGRTLWGGEVADELMGATADLVSAAPGLYVDVGTYAAGGIQSVSRLLELDHETGARLRAIDLARAPGFEVQTVVTVQTAANGDLWICTRDGSLHGPDRQLRAQRWSSDDTLVDERVVHVGTSVVTQWLASAPIGAQGSVAIAQHADLGAELLLIDIETAQLQWSLALPAAERPMSLWVADGQVVAEVTGPDSPSALAVRSWQLDDGQPRWSLDLDPGAGFRAHPGTWVGNSIRFPYTREWRQSAVEVDTASGAPIYAPETPSYRRSASSSGWFSLAQRLITGQLSASPADGPVLRARAVDASDGTPLWTTQQTIPSPAVLSVAVAPLVGGVRADRIWATLAVSRNPTAPTDVIAVAVDAATGSVQRMVSRAAAGAATMIVGIDDTLYLGHSGGCAETPATLPVVEAINFNGSRRWCQTAPGATPTRPFSVVGALPNGVAVGVDLAPGSGQRVAMLDGSDGGERWSLLLPWSVARTLYPRISPDRLLFRYRPFSTDAVVDGEIDTGSGQLSWQSSFEPSFSRANAPASVLLQDGSWVRAAHGWSPQAFFRVQSHSSGGFLNWQMERTPAGVTEAAVLRMVATPDSVLVLETEHWTGAFVYRSLAQVDPGTGAWLGERVIDAVDSRLPLGRGKLTALVSARPNGGLAVLASKPAWPGRYDTVLQGWPAWSGTPAGNLAIGVAARIASDPRITSLGRRARLVLDIASAVDRPVLAQLLAASSLAASLQIVDCAIPGGNCQSIAGDGQLPARIQLPAFATGQIEIEFVVRSSAFQSAGELELLLAAGPELLETGLDDNRINVSYLLGPHRNGFE